MHQAKWFRFITVNAGLALASEGLFSQQLSFIESNGKSDFHYVTIDVESRRLHTHEDDYELSDIARVYWVCGSETTYICFVESDLYIVFAFPRNLGESKFWTFGGHDFSIEDQFDFNGESFYLIASTRRAGETMKSQGDSPQEEVSLRSSFVYSEKKGLITYMKYRLEDDVETLISVNQYGEGLDFRVLEESGRGMELFSASEVDMLSREEFYARDFFSFLSSRESAELPAVTP